MSHFLPPSTTFVQATSTAFAAILANGRVRTWGDRFRGGDSGLGVSWGGEGGWWEGAGELG